jgi:hypothetical protein
MAKPIVAKGQQVSAMKADRRSFAAPRLSKSALIR